MGVAEGLGEVPCWPPARPWPVCSACSRTVAGRPFAEVVWEFFAAHPLPG